MEHVIMGAMGFDRGSYDRCQFNNVLFRPLLLYIDLKRITRCKLALIFTSADCRKFLGLFGSEAARL